MAKRMAIAGSVTKNHPWLTFMRMKKKRGMMPGGSIMTTGYMNTSMNTLRNEKMKEYKLKMPPKLQNTKAHQRVGALGILNDQ
jgi:hypothetical protein